VTARRIAVIGSPGCGKSYLASRIAEYLGLPLIRLDDEYWHAGWARTRADTWDRRVRELAGADRWVIDGNYGATLAVRVRAADLVVFVDRPTWPCLLTVLRRIGRWVVGHRVGLPARVATGARIVPPAGDLVRFLWLVASFRRRVRPTMSRLLAAPDAAPCVRLTSRADVNTFLRQTRMVRS